MSKESEQIRSNLIQYAEENRFSILFRGNETRTVIIGEQHQIPLPSHNEQQSQQIKLMESIKPGKLLHEGFTCFEYQGKTGEFGASRTAPISEGEVDAWLEYLKGNYPDSPVVKFQPLLDLANKISLHIIGCDLTFAEVEDIVLNNNPYRNKILDLTRNNQVLLLSVLSLGCVKPRADHMFTTISQHQGTPEKPSMAIIGIEHALDVRYDRPELTDYCLIEQVPKEIRRKMLPYHQGLKENAGRFAQLISKGEIAEPLAFFYEFANELNS